MPRENDFRIYDGIIKRTNGVPRLKHCPYCGNKDLTLVSCTDLPDCDNFKKCSRPLFYALCCDVNKGGCGAMSGYQKSPAKAVSMWNKRDNKRRVSKPITREELDKMLKPYRESLKDLDAIWGEED